MTRILVTHIKRIGAINLKNKFLLKKESITDTDNIVDKCKEVIDGKDEENILWKKMLTKMKILLKKLMMKDKNLAILAASALSWLELTIQLSLLPCKQKFNIKWWWRWRWSWWWWQSWYLLWQTSGMGDDHCGSPFSCLLYNSTKPSTSKDEHHSFKEF